MSVWVLIPVKPLSESKSRLADLLTIEQRASLAETLLRRTLGVVTTVPQIAGVLVISRDGAVLSIARDLGARTVQESGNPELNSALMRATTVLQSWRANAVLILPADVPLISAEDLRYMIELGRGVRDTVVITPDRVQDGTNALFVRPPGLFSYAYGPGSYQNHVKLARLAGADVKLYESERLMLDIDTPEDMEIYQQYIDEDRFGAEPLFSADGASEN